jgi:hypothetical protein
MYNKLSEELLELVWEKGEPIVNENPDKYRLDKYGHWIAKNEFESFESLLGWHANKINSKDSVSIENLEPLFWKNTR